MAQRAVKTALERRHPLLVTDDQDLLDTVLGIAERCGADLEVAPDLAAAKGRFCAAPLVLIGAQAVSACANGSLPRRPGVILIGTETAPEPPWPAAEAIGAEHVALLPQAASWLADRIAGAVGQSSMHRGRVITVMGGRGGAGASVLAAGLAITAANRGMKAFLIDADPLGGGVDLVLGWERLDGARWSSLSQTSGTISPPAFVEALPKRGQLSVLSWDKSAPFDIPVDAMATALDAGRDGNNLVVVDLPRRLDDATIMALSAADLALLIVPAELRACAAAARVAAKASEHTATLSLVVRGPAPGGLKAREISRALGLPSFGTLRSEPDLARGLEHGEAPTGHGRGALTSLCQRVLADLGLSDRTRT